MGDLIVILLATLSGVVLLFLTGSGVCGGIKFILFMDEHGHTLTHLARNDKEITRHWQLAEIEARIKELEEKTESKRGGKKK